MTKTPSKKIRSVKKTVEFPAFGYTVHVVLTDDVLGYAKRRWKGVPFYPADGLHVSVKGENVSWVLLEFNPLAGNIAHESWHAVRKMLDSCDAELESEVVAYHIGYLVNVIFTFMMDTKDKEKKNAEVNSSSNSASGG